MEGCSGAISLAAFASILPVGSGPAWVFPPQFIEEDLTQQSPVCDSVGTTGVSGEFLHPLP